MMTRGVRLLAAAVVLISGAAVAKPVRPFVQPAPPPVDGSGDTGVIRPATKVDPGMKVIRPKMPAAGTPVIKPKGPAPGGTVVVPK